MVKRCISLSSLAEPFYRDKCMPCMCSLTLPILLDVWLCKHRKSIHEGPSTTADFASLGSSLGLRKLVAQLGVNHSLSEVL